MGDTGDKSTTQSRPRYSSETQGTRRRLNMGELHHTYSMTLHKRITRYRIPSRIMNYDSPPAQCNLYNLIPSHSLYETVVELSEYQRKEGRTKHQISVQLISASRMKKNDPMLSTWNTLKTRLFQFKESTLQEVRTDSLRPIKTR